MKNIKQLEKEIKECPFTPEAFQDELEKEPERHCSTCRVNVLKIKILKEVCKEIEEDIELQKTNYTF